MYKCIYYIYTHIFMIYVIKLYRLIVMYYIDIYSIHLYMVDNIYMPI